jgi:hypothetical protein
MTRLKKMGWGVNVRVAAVMGALALISASAFGTAIGTGQANTAGRVTVNSNGIFFSNFVPVTIPCSTTDCPGPTIPSNGPYTGTTSVLQGNLVGTPTLTPNLTDWAEFVGASAGLIKFDLQTLNPGTGTLAGCGSNAQGSTCTPTGSPITLTQISASSVSISLSGNGRAYTGTNATSSPTLVSFSSQNNVPGTITSILAAVLSSDGFTNSVSATYSTTGVSTVPEPMTLSMMGFGLMGLGLIARRRKS